MADKASGKELFFSFMTKSKQLPSSPVAKSLYLHSPEPIAGNILNEIGFQYMILRQFTPQDLRDYPGLQSQIYQSTFTELKKSRKNIYQWSGHFIKKVNRYISSLVVQSPPFKNNNK